MNFYAAFAGQTSCPGLDIYTAQSNYSGEYLYFLIHPTIPNMTRLQKGQQYFQVEEITPKNRVF
ncbi:MAG: hypothetical protein B5M51_03500 [Anaerolinea sp. 4484_236]|nr:MAG: hypothetical protein B5M51_03500 [Anaerolinea sp. 4484_236]